MNGSLRDMNDEGLHAVLRAVARRVDYPPTPPLAEGVRRRIEAASKPRRLRPSLRFRPQPALAAVGALVIAFVATLTFSPQAREAVADLIGLGGVRIGFGEGSRDEPPSDELALGPRVSLAEAEKRVGFAIKIPRLAGLSRPEVHFTTPPESGMVSLLYPDAYVGTDQPALLITQFRADIDDGFFKKIATGEAKVESAAARGSLGYWVRGAHSFVYIDGSGNRHEETLRLAANVLLWEEDGVTYRVEGGFGKTEALKIAESLTD